MNKNKRLGTALENAVVEDAIAAGHQARKQPLSGVLKAFPHDAVVDDVLLECKIRAPLVDGTAKGSFRFDLGWLKRVTVDAKEAGHRLGAVVFRAKGAQEKYVVLRYADFLNLLSKNTE